MPLVYDQLRALARSKLGHVPPGNTLQPTALVHEAYLRLVGDSDKGWDGRAHFFGAAALAMRDILVKTINEDLTEVAPLVRCKTLLIFGAQDDQTPPEMGERYRRYIRGAELVVLDGFDHYTVLTDGQHQLARMIKPLITENHAV